MDAKEGIKICKLNGQIDKRGHYDDMKGWMLKRGHYDGQIKRVDG